MKTLKIFSLFFFIFLLNASFVFAQYGNNHNWKYSAKRLSVGEIYVSLNGEAYLGDEFPIGSQVQFIFDELSGYNYQNGRAFPRIAMRVLEKNSGQVVMQYGNLLKEYEYSGLRSNAASRLTTSLTIGDPMSLGGHYTCEITITEGTGKGKIDLKYNFEVVSSGGYAPQTVSNNPFLYDTNELSLEEVSLEINGQPYGDTDLPVKQTVDMVFKGINGLSAVGGRVYPGMAIRVTDQFGNVVLNESDLFKGYDQSGISWQRAQRLVSSLTIGNPMKLGQQYKWEVRIWDKRRASKTVDAELNFRVIQ